MREGFSAIDMGPRSSMVENAPRMALAAFSLRDLANLFCEKRIKYNSLTSLFRFFKYEIVNNFLHKEKICKQFQAFCRFFNVSVSNDNNKVTL